MKLESSEEDEVLCKVHGIVAELLCTHQLNLGV